MCIRSKTKLNAEMLEAATNLMAIGCFCIGTDTTDLKLAALKGIPVFNSPYANSRSVAELVIAEMIMMARQVCPLLRWLLCWAATPPFCTP